MEFNEHETIRRLSDLPRLSRLAFAASCSQRQFPAYEDFCQKTGWDKSSVVKSLLTSVWTYIASLGTEDLSDATDSYLELVPDSDDFGSVETAYAQRAASSVLYTTSAVLTGDPAVLVLPARLATEAVDLWIQDQPSDEIDQSRLFPLLRGMRKERMLAIVKEWERLSHEGVAAHPVMVTEILKQQSDLDALGNRQLSAVEVNLLYNASRSSPVLPL